MDTGRALRQYQTDTGRKVKETNSRLSASPAFQSNIRFAQPWFLSDTFPSPLFSSLALCACGSYSSVQTGLASLPGAG